MMGAYSDRVTSGATKKVRQPTKQREDRTYRTGSKLRINDRRAEGSFVTTLSILEVDILQTI